LGAAVYVSKPIDKHRLLDQIRALLQGVRQTNPDRSISEIVPGVMRQGD